MQPKLSEHFWVNPEEENIIWVESKPISKCPGLTNVIVGDELGNTFWLLYMPLTPILVENKKINVVKLVESIDNKTIIHRFVFKLTA